MLRRGFMLLLALSSCTPSQKPASQKTIALPSASAAAGGGEALPQSSRETAFEAVLHVEPKPGEKRFQGVWLERDDGAHWIVSYRAEVWWRPFDNRRVHVEGETYEPKGQAIMAPHFRIKSLKIVDAEAAPMAEYVELGEEQSVSGVIELYEWPEGDKLAGEKQPHFVRADGETFWLANLPLKQLEYGKKVHLRARETEPSRYMAHAGGKWLFVVWTEEE